MIDECEAVVDDVASILSALLTACQKNVFPNWTNGLLDKVNDGRLQMAVERLLNENTYLLDLNQPFAGFVKLKNISYDVKKNMTYYTYDKTIHHPTQAIIAPIIPAIVSTIVSTNPGG